MNTSANISTCVRISLRTPVKTPLRASLPTWRADTRAEPRLWRFVRRTRSLACPAQVFVKVFANVSCKGVR